LLVNNSNKVFKNSILLKNQHSARSLKGKERVRKKQKGQAERSLCRAARSLFLTGFKALCSLKGKKCPFLAVIFENRLNRFKMNVSY